MNVFVLAVAGGSCSGKTTFANKILDALGEENVLIVRQDSFYHDQSDKFDGDGGSVNFDHPDSLDFDLLKTSLNSLKQGKTSECPIYHFDSHSRDEKSEALPARPIVVVDGTLVLQQEILHAHMTHKVFVHACEKTRFSRRLNRDTKERGRTEDGVKKQFELQVKPMHDKFVEPSKSFADLILTPETFDEGLQNIVKLLQDFLKE